MKNKRPGELKKLCDIQVRKYLLKNAERGPQNKVKCFITGRFFREEDVHVAHYISRGNMTYRFSLLNCNLVNRWSNTEDSKVYDSIKYGNMSKHHFEYREALIREYGESVLDRLSEVRLNVFYKEEYLQVLESLKDTKKFYKYYFEEMLYIKNKHYREGVFTVIGEFKNLRGDILVEDKYGKSKIPTASILTKGYKPDISTAVNKVEYVNNILSEVDKDYEVIEYIDSLNVIVLDEYGKCSMSLDSLRRGYKPGIRSAVDKNAYFLSKAKALNTKIDWGKVKVLSKYENKETFMYIQDFLGVYRITSQEIFKNVGPSYKKYLNKGEVDLNKFGKGATIYNNIDYSKKTVEEQEYICVKHGKYLQSISNHRNCQHCCPKCNVFSSYRREDWVHKLGNKSKGEFYIIRCYDEYESFLKVGITSNFKRRYHNKAQMPYKVEKLVSIKSRDRGKIWDLEEEILDTIGYSNYTPRKFFRGSVYEVFSEDTLPKIMEIVVKNKIGEKNFENLLELSEELSIFGVDKYLEVLEQYKTEENER